MTASSRPTPSYVGDGDPVLIARVLNAARAWRKLRNFEYRPGEINPHLLTAHQEDLDLARAVDALDGAA